MIIQNISRDQAVRLLYQQGLQSRRLISISDNLWEEKEMRALCQDLMIPPERCLFLHFADVDDGYSGFTNRTATYVIDFVVQAIEAGSDILVHCLVGQSRSGAIAKFVNDYWAVGDTHLEDYTGYNTHVYSTLEETFKRRFYERL